MVNIEKEKNEKEENIVKINELYKKFFPQI